jgi:hypothetical protein
MEVLSKAIKANKPNISASSLKTYCSTLKAFYYRHHDPDDELKISWFENQDKIISLLKDANVNSRKTMFSAIISMVKDNEKYKKAMMADITTKKEEMITQEKSPAQEENWIDYPEIVKKVDSELTKCMPLLTSHAGHLDSSEIQKLTGLMILCLTTGKYIPPRRNMDLNLLKYKNYDDKKDNYVQIDPHKHIYNLVFNKYKTSGTYEGQVIEMPLGLRPIIIDFIRHKGEDDSDYLLTKKNGSPFQNNDIGKVLEGFFKKKIGTSMLRHIYLSNKYKDIPALTEMKETAREMGHSVGQALEYIKK